MKKVICLFSAFLLLLSSAMTTFVANENTLVFLRINENSKYRFATSL